MVNSAMTSMEATVRNLSYMGKWSRKKSVKPIMLRPQERAMESIVTTSRHQGSGPFTSSSPSTKSMQTKAPT